MTDLTPDDLIDSQYMPAEEYTGPDEDPFDGLDKTNGNGGGGTERHPRLALHYFADIAAFDTGGGLIDDILAPGALSLVYGESGSRKTFLALDMALAVARGITWRDRETQQTSVLYVACEAGRSFANRVVAYRTHHGLDETALAFAAITEPVNLRDEGGDIGPLIDRIKQAGEKFEKPVGMVLLDTMSRALNGGDENSPADMGRLVANLDRIRAETSAHVMGVHHSGKDTTKGARGHSLLRAAVDTEIEVVPDGVAAFSTATVRKQRDLPTDGSFAFGLTVVDIGAACTGKPITSCVVEHMEGGARPAAKPRKLTDKQRLALNALQSCITDHGEPSPGGQHYPASARVVSVDLWREHLVKAGIVDPSAANPREDFRRVRNGLAERGAVAEWNNLIWLAGKAR